MCGIAGAVGGVDESIQAIVRTMTNAQKHRGPDDSGLYVPNDGADVALGFRRLAILDLTPGGHQPMVDPDRGNVVVFNGEIYNHEELRAELEGRGERFHSRSDTEVLLRGYGRWGRGVLERLSGMFAFAIYDPRKASVLVARDRLGIKPLYVATLERGSKRTLLFASELRAILATGAIPRKLDRTALATYLWNGFVVGPSTMVEGVTLLPPGSYASLDLRDPHAKPERYWALEPERAEREGEARERLESELLVAARQHLMSDVPLGVFLSGGVDSSAVAALAVRAEQSIVKTFHIGFDEAAFDESRYARAVATALGTEHAEYRLTQDQFQAGLEGGMASLDQPTFDALNTYFVSRVVREAGFTVALAGTGGDELFGGYRSFRDLPRGQRAARAARLVPKAWIAGLTQQVARLRGGKNGGVPPQTRWAKLGDLLQSRGDRLASYQVAYGLFTRDFLAELAPSQLLALAPNGLPPERSLDLAASTRDASDLSTVSAFELALFLGERLLRDSDAASMAVSLELRVPLLDHRVVEAVNAVPDGARFRPLGKKELLKSLAMPHLDPALFDRPKAGFVLPIEVWAKDRLAGDIAAVFGDSELVRRVGMNGDALNRLFAAFRAGRPGIYWSRVWAPYVLLRWCRTHDLALG
jgi:asparagine synthase (glutamine-hydrolysing)